MVLLSYKANKILYKIIEYFHVSYIAEYARCKYILFVLLTKQKYAIFVSSTE